MTCDPLKLSIYSTKSLKAWALRTDVLELSTDILSLPAACLRKWSTQSRWYLAPSAIISPSDNFPIRVLSPILWAHELTLASKPRVDALLASQLCPAHRVNICHQVLSTSYSLLVQFIRVPDHLDLTGLDDVKDEAHFFCHCRALFTSCFSAEHWQNSCHATLSPNMSLTS